MCFFALQFTAEEIQTVNEMERMALDKVTPFPFLIRNVNDLFSDETTIRIC